MLGRPQPRVEPSCPIQSVGLCQQPGACICLQVFRDRSDIKRYPRELPQSTITPTQSTNISYRSPPLSPLPPPPLSPHCRLILQLPALPLLIHHPVCQATSNSAALTSVACHLISATSSTSSAFTLPISLHSLNFDYDLHIMQQPD